MNEIKKMIRGIYSAIQESGITSHKYYDEKYCKVHELRDIAEGAALAFFDDIRVLFSNISEYDDHREYNMSIEDANTGFVYGGGVITACFCGSVDFPRGAYDLCATWWDGSVLKDW